MKIAPIQFRSTQAIKLRHSDRQGNGEFWISVNKEYVYCENMLVMLFDNWNLRNVDKYKTASLKLRLFLKWKANDGN